MNISIHTAQNVTIAYKPAGLVPRIAATAIDLLLLGGIYILCLAFISPFPGLVNNPTTHIIIVTILMLYHLVCEYFFNGKSIGKLISHSRVVRLDGQKLSFWDCLLRWILRLPDISISLGIVAISSIIVSSKMQRLGDLAAGTTVILEKEKTDLNKITDFDSPEDHQVIFPQIAILSDKDFSIIREVYQEFEKQKEYRLLEPLADKIKELTGIQTRMDNLEFIRTALRDYIHLTK